MTTPYNPDLDGSAVHLALTSIDLLRSLKIPDTDIRAVIERDFPGLLNVEYLFCIADGLVADFTEHRNNPSWRVPKEK